jgi:hypothetical protein
MNKNEIYVMIFYSLLTYFIGPRIAPYIIKNYPDNYIPGFILGFSISVFLWINYGKYYSNK